MLKEFKSNEFGNVRTIEESGQVWFVAIDVCKALNHSNPTVAMNMLEEDERTKLSLGRQGVANVVNESGLYTLIIKSNKKEAKKFRRWVTSEVLPSIRQNGGYLANQENMDEEQIMARALQVAQNVIDRKNKEIESMKPKAEYFNALVDRNLLTNFRDTAKELKVGQKGFINFLLDNKYIYRDGHNTIKPYSQYVPSLFELKEWQRGDKSGTQTLITPKGRETFRLLIKEGN